MFLSCLFEFVDSHDSRFYFFFVIRSGILAGCALLLGSFILRISRLLLSFSFLQSCHHLRSLSGFFLCLLFTNYFPDVLSSQQLFLGSRHRYSWITNMV
ncbi:hypothetical protein Pelo_2772 [Pelomyxa schiedti]|nr:hypothetical protein Pelo_2772 [Pelomyxa schiedti]